MPRMRSSQQGRLKEAISIVLMDYELFLLVILNNKEGA